MSKNKNYSHKYSDHILLFFQLSIILTFLILSLRDYNLSRGAMVIKEGSFTIYVDTTDPSYVHSQLTIDTTAKNSSDEQEGFIIPQNDKRFNKIESDKALDELTKILLKTGKMQNKNHTVFICSGFDPSSRCYIFSQGEDMGDRYAVNYWWKYYIDSKKVFNDISGEELFY